MLSRLQQVLAANKALEVAQGLHLGVNRHMRLPAQEAVPRLDLLC